MAKYILIIGFLSLAITNVNAQLISLSNSNPFRNLQFVNSPTDTISFIVVFNNAIGKISDGDIDMLSVISTQSKSNFNYLKYAIGFRIPGYPQSFYAPCKDNDMYNALIAKQSALQKLKISCVVYRFYYINPTSNFFYIDRVSIAN